MSTFDHEKNKANDQSVDGWCVGDSRTIEHQFTTNDINSFAKLTGDYNPLHVDHNYAATTATGGQVVHGMLVASFISTLIGMEIPGPGALWNDFQVSWRKIVRIDDTLRFTATVSSINSSLDLIVLEIRGVGVENDELYIDGSAKVMVMSKKKVISSFMLGKKILVTGASGILGTTVCKQLSDEGAELILWGRNSERLEELKNTLSTAVIDVICCDLSDEEAVKEQSKTLFLNNNIDGIIHTAAHPLNLTSAVDWNNLFELKRHLNIGVIALQQLVTAFMENRLAKRGGFIVTVLTEAVFDVPPDNMSAYVATKMASWGLIKSYAKELGPLGVRCNAVSPGLMETPYSSEISIRAKKIEEATNPMRRICNPDDVARAILFLSTASFVNGTNLPVTGGQRMP
jgi:3-oxoacyl-[acyl-carrier protein] reductase